MASPQSADRKSSFIPSSPTAEHLRLAQDATRELNWKRWGPYLSERQWGTVREDYSPDGKAWDYLPHDHARSRAYRWGEDGILGITDRECRLCFAIALWNGRDPFLKERLFGLVNEEGNHGEDVKENYYFLDSTPTHSYMRALYKYPQMAYPYARLIEENRRRSRTDRELELEDLGAFDGGRYFDVEVRYAKATPNDLLIEIIATNRATERAPLHLLPTLWFRNTWVWGCRHEGCTMKPRIDPTGPLSVRTKHETLGEMLFAWDECADAIEPAPQLLFTDNHTNTERLYNWPNSSPWVKDAFHRAVVAGDSGALNPRRFGTKVSPHFRFDLAPGQSVKLRARLRDPGAAAEGQWFGAAFDDTFRTREAEADAFYASVIPAGTSEEQRRVARQGWASLLWSKQFYHLIVRDWLAGDPDQPAPPAGREAVRNGDWNHLYSRDILSMPDTWEYPWFAAWDLAFHMLPFAQIDPAFAKQQLELLLREWYMHPNGQIPAYEYNFGDVNPPVHAWACWRVYKMTAPRGQRDIEFLERVFHKLLLNFTWWVNRKDPRGRNIFGGGFLGLDNIGVFDRSQPLPMGGTLEQADATAWMAFMCGTMLSMALEIARYRPAYEDIASKFFEHFVAIADAMNHLGGTGLWNEEDGFYYDQILLDGRSIPLRIRSIVGVIPLLAAIVIEQDNTQGLRGFQKRTDWFLRHRQDLSRSISWLDRSEVPTGAQSNRFLLAIPSKDRLLHVLRYLFDEEEFLSPYGIRSLSRIHEKHPYEFRDPGDHGAVHRVAYLPGESDSGMFGGNSNWRGPIWFPVNHLIIEALERYSYFYGDTLRVEYPTRSGNMLTLAEIAKDLGQRLARIFLPDAAGNRPCHGGADRYARDPHFRDLVLFHEYFHGDTGRGLGASHQTGWTALVTRYLVR